jgi:hypothetical protein
MRGRWGRIASETGYGVEGTGLDGEPGEHADVLNDGAEPIGEVAPLLVKVIDLFP